MEHITTSKPVKQQIIDAFEEEFAFIRDKFEMIELLTNDTPMERKAIERLKLNFVWHPGVYCFIGNNSLYRVGVSMINSRARVMRHLMYRTAQGDNCIWDIDGYEDKSILLFNVKNQLDHHWLLALEVFIEKKFKPRIKAGRIG